MAEIWKNPSTECAYNIKEKEDQCTWIQPEMWKLVVLEWRVCDALKGFNSFWVCTLEFTLGYGVKKIILKTVPIKLPRCSFLQDEIINNHQVLAPFLPEIICSIRFSGYLASLRSLQILVYLIWVLVFYQIMNTWKSLLASAFIMKVSPLFIYMAI